jgi:hypothetical protein
VFGSTEKAYGVAGREEVEEVEDEISSVDCPCLFDIEEVRPAGGSVVEDRCPRAGDRIMVGDFLEAGIEAGIEFFLPINSSELDDVPRGIELNFIESFIDPVAVELGSRAS